MENNKIVLTPKEIHKKLNDYVIGQEDAKKVLSTGIYNHWKRILCNCFNANVSEELSDIYIEKSNILLMGPSGTGKTYMIKNIAQMLHIPCYIADATRLTPAGYVGNDIETIITGLLQEASYDVSRAQTGIIVVDEADKLARKGDSLSLTRNVGGESVQQGILKIVEGSLVDVPPQGGRKHPEQPLIYVDTSNILFIFVGTFDGIDKIINKRNNFNKIGFNTNHESKNIIKDVTTEDLQQFGFITELIGRFPIITSTEKLTIHEMKKILTDTKNSLLKQYQKLMAVDNINLKFDDKAIEWIAEYSYKQKTGARGLKTVMEKILNNIMYDFSGYTNHEIIINSEYINNVLNIKKAA